MNNHTNEIQEIPEVIENQGFSETIVKHKCKICKQEKLLDSFHKLEIKVSNIILQGEYFIILCKDCLPIEALYIDYKKELKINQKILNSHFFINSKIKFEKEHGISIDNLIWRSQAVKILDTNNKNWIKDKVSMGLLTEYTFIKSPGDFEQTDGKQTPVIEKYYLPQQIELLKYIKENGYLYMRTKPSIKRGAAFIENPPYLVSGSNGRQYLFSNDIEKKKVCNICLQIKDFNEFNKQSNLPNNLSNECSDCESSYMKEKWENLDEESKKKQISQIKEWTKNNPDKVKEYRKTSSIHRIGKPRKKYESRKTPQYKIRKALKNRFKKIVSRASSQTWREWISRQTSPIFFTTSKLLGISLIDFIKYVESKWLPGMTWENYGLQGYELDEFKKPIKENNEFKRKIGWQIDHIRPLSDFNLKNTEDLKRVNHYTNLLPMWWWDNNGKSDKTELCPILDKELLDKYKELEILIKKT